MSHDANDFVYKKVFSLSNAYYFVGTINDASSTKTGQKSFTIEFRDSRSTLSEIIDIVNNTGGVDTTQYMPFF